MLLLQVPLPRSSSGLGRRVLIPVTGVRVPYGVLSLEKDVVRSACRKAGTEPDLSGLFWVRALARKPEEPGIAVEYRDHWFFIPDSDHASKRTFALMQAIFLSQTIEDSAQGAPVLTLPLN